MNISASELKTAYRKAVLIKELPISVWQVINHYFHLRIGNKEVPAPYFINDSMRFHWKRVLSGKGKAAEIEQETEQKAKDKNFNLEKVSPKEIRDFMSRRSLGIDCSGFVTWVLDELVRIKLNTHIWNVIKFDNEGTMRAVIQVIRPVENMGVKTYADPKNTVEIKSLKKIQPGDLIITEKNNHILLISKIGFDTNKTPVYFEYVNSKINVGVKKDVVFMNNTNDSLVNQTWVDLSTLKIDELGVMNQNHSGGFVARLRALS